MSFYLYKFAAEEKKKDNTKRNLALGATALALAAGGTAYAVSPEFRNSVNNAVKNPTRAADSVVNNITEVAGYAKDDTAKALSKGKNYLTSSKLTTSKIDMGSKIKVDRPGWFRKNILRDKTAPSLSGLEMAKVRRVDYTPSPIKTVSNKFNNLVSSTKGSIQSGYNTTRDGVMDRYYNFVQQRKLNSPELKPIMDEITGAGGRRSPM